jgi:hypothetical protein
MRSGVVVMLCVLAVAGCGGQDEDRAVTVVQTQVVDPPATSSPAPDAPTGPSGPTGADGPTGTPAPAPDDAAVPPPAELPAGLAAIDGDFTTEVTGTDPPQANANGTTQLTEETWVLSTTCTGTRCELAIRRRLGAGGVQDVVLRPDRDRRDLWFGSFRSTGTCGGRRVAADSSLTLRPQGATEDGRARRFEAYWRAQFDCFGEPVAVSRIRARPAA